MNTGPLGGHNYVSQRWLHASCLTRVLVLGLCVANSWTCKKQQNWSFFPTFWLTARPQQVLVCYLLLCIQVYYNIIFPDQILTVFMWTCDASALFDVAMAKYKWLYFVKYNPHLSQLCSLIRFADITNQRWCCLSVHEHKTVQGTIFSFGLNEIFEVCGDGIEHWTDPDVHCRTVTSPDF